MERALWILSEKIEKGQEVGIQNLDTEPQVKNIGRQKLSPFNQWNHEDGWRELPLYIRKGTSNPQLIFPFLSFFRRQLQFFLQDSPMDTRILLFVLVLATVWCCNARVVTTNYSPVQDGIASALQQINLQEQESKVDAAEEFEAIKQICTLCKKIAKPLLNFLSNSSNQEKITSTLTKICSLSLGLKDKCNGAVDYYLPLLYLQVATWTPQTFCITIGLCNIIVSTSQHHSKNSCESCHDLVAGIRLQLKDSHARLQATEALLKACDTLKGFEDVPKKCKTLLSSYAPLVLDSIELFLESYDVCSTLDAYRSSPNATAHVDSVS